MCLIMFNTNPLYAPEISENLLAYIGDFTFEIWALTIPYPEPVYTGWSSVQ